LITYLYPVKWDHAISDYTHYLRLERGLSENTISNYRRDIAKLAKVAEIPEAAFSPLEADRKNIEAFIHEIARELHPRSQARIISGLRGFFDYLIFEGYRKDNPMELIETPKTGRKLPDTLSTAEIDQIIGMIDRSRPEGERNRAMLETLYGCGLRVSELLDLRLSDLFFSEGFIKVKGKGNKERFVPIGAHNQACIDLYLEEIRPHFHPKKPWEDTVFLNRYGRRLSRAMVFTVVKDLSLKAGLKKRISPHTFRHSFATHLLRNGADIRAIQQMLGHESITTTEVYMHVDRTHLSEVVRRYHPRRNA
jgi:integrase/recombinase XerD